MYRTSGTRMQRSSLEVFILALISKGYRTMYDLQRAAGLSVGATTPALARLSKARLVTKKILGRRHEFSLTKSGERVLGQWSMPSARLTDYDDVLRTAFLCVFLNRDKATATEVLSQAARARARASEDRQDEMHGAEMDTRSFNADAYRWMRTLSDRFRLEAEGRALEAIAAEFQRKHYARK